VRSYYCICTSCVSFVKASDIAELLQRTAYVVMRSAFQLSHAIRLLLPPAPNPVKPLILGLPFASCPGWKTIKAAAVGCCGCIRIQNKLDYIHSPAHCCITQPPCMAPSGDSARVSVNYANHQHSPFARRRHDFRQAAA